MPLLVETDEIHFPVTFDRHRVRQRTMPASGVARARYPGPTLDTATFSGDMNRCGRFDHSDALPAAERFSMR